MSTPDTNYLSIADVDGYTLNRSRFDPRDEGKSEHDYDDILKFSHARNVRGGQFYVRGGRENCIDMNRMCAEIELEDATLEGGDQSAIVIKGGSTGIRLRRFVYTAVTGWCDVLIGDWSDQSYAKTTGVLLVDHLRKDGQPVRVVVGRGDWPTVVGGNVKICYGLSYATKAYWWAKWLWVRVCLRKVPMVMHV